MKNNSIVKLIIAIVILAGCTSEDRKGSIKVMSLNIRMDTPDDGINAWPNRRDFLTKSIYEITPDVAGLQEVLIHQLNDLDSLLPWYDYVGVGRDDGVAAGEFSPIFYKMNRFDLMSHSTFWLSEYPDSVGSVGWDAALPRIVSWAKFHDRHINRDFYFLNTHFDHIGELARLESVKLIQKFIAENTEGLPVVMTGDFNLEPDSKAIQLFLQDDNLQIFDAYTQSLTDHSGVDFSFNGFGKTEHHKRIDYIFVDDHWQIYDHVILPLKNDEVFISDHYPVVGTVKMIAK